MKRREVMYWAVFLAVFVLAGTLYYFMKVYLPPEGRLALAFNSLETGMSIEQVQSLFPKDQFFRLELKRSSGGWIFLISYRRISNNAKQQLASAPDLLKAMRELTLPEDILFISIDAAGTVDAYDWLDTREMREAQGN